jgi:mRNA interferase MazF
MRTDPQPGQVYVVDLGYAAKSRMVLIVSVRASTAPLAVVTGLSLTRQFHGTPFEVPLPKLPWMTAQSYVNAQSLGGFKFVELGHYCGQIESGPMEQVRGAVRLWLGC